MNPNARAFSQLGLLIAVAFPALAAVIEDPIDSEMARRRIAEIVSAEAAPEQIDALEEIAARTPDADLAALAAYNAGTIALTLGDDRAERLLRQADERGRAADVRANARFNLAHTAYEEADPGTPPSSIEEIDERLAGLARSAALFRSVLDVAPDREEAAANTERVRRKIRDLEKLRDRLEQQEQMRQELAEQLEELARQQQQQAEQSQSRSEQTDAQTTQEQQQTENQQAAEEQRALSQQTERARERTDEAGTRGNAEEAMEQARQAQQRAQEALENNNAEAAAEAQRDAAEALRRAAEATRPPPQPERGEGSGQQEEGQASEPTEAEQPGEAPGITPLAESLLDKERREREQRMRYLQKTGRQRVERDW